MCLISMLHRACFYFASSLISIHMKEKYHIFKGSSSAAYTQAYVSGGLTFSQMCNMLMTLCHAANWRALIEYSGDSHSTSADCQMAVTMETRCDVPKSTCSPHFHLLFSWYDSQHSGHA